MGNCPYCMQANGKHTPKCPLNPPTALNSNVPLIGQAQPKVIPSLWFCPVCNYNPPTVDHKEAKGLPLTQTVLVHKLDGVDAALCPQCWARFVAAHAPRLVKREVVDGTPEA